jgi:hypothetical protein
MTELPSSWVKLFMARQKDLKLAKNIELQFTRFAQIVKDQKPEKTVLRNEGFGLHSAKVLARILKNSKDIVSIDCLFTLKVITQSLDSLIHWLSLTRHQPVYPRLMDACLFSHLF